MKFTFITVSAPSLKCLIKAAKEILRIEPGILDLRLYYAVTEYSKEKTDRLIADIKTSDMVFVDLNERLKADVAALESYFTEQYGISISDMANS